MATEETKKRLELTAHTCVLMAQVEELEKKIKRREEKDIEAVLTRIETRGDIEELFTKLNRLEAAVAELRGILVGREEPELVTV